MHLPLQNRLSKLNSAISSKIQDKKLRRVTIYHDESTHQQGQYCLSCSRVRTRSIQKHDETQQKSTLTKSFSRKRILQQYSLTLHPQQPTTTKSLSDIQKHNIRLMERSQQLQEQYKSNCQQMLKKLHYCQQALETYNIEEISRQVSAMIRFLSLKVDHHEDAQRQIKVKKQHDFYQKLIETMKKLICQSDERLFIKTKRALFDHNYLSVQQFQNDLNDLSMAEMKKIQLVDTLKSQLKNIAQGNKLHSQGVLAGWGLVPEIKMLEKAIKQKQSQKSKDMLMESMDLLERAKLRLNFDLDFSDRIEEFLRNVRKQYSLQSNENPNTPYSDMYYMLLIQSSAIEDFLVGNPDTDSQY